jgi:hypothetical protein
MASQDNSPTQVDIAAVSAVAGITTRSEETNISSDALFFQSKVDHNKALAARPSHKRHLKCRCLAVMNRRNDYCETVAEYQMMFSNLSCVEQKKVVIEWMRAKLVQGNRTICDLEESWFCGDVGTKSTTYILCGVDPS